MSNYTFLKRGARHCTQERTLNDHSVQTVNSPGAAFQGSRCLWEFTGCLPQCWQASPNANAKKSRSDSPSIGLGMFGTCRLLDIFHMLSGEQVETRLVWKVWPL